MHRGEKERKMGIFNAEEIAQGKRGRGCHPWEGRKGKSSGCEKRLRKKREEKRAMVETRKLYHSR